MDWASPGGSVVKNPPAKQEALGLIPGSMRFPEKEMTTCSSIVALEIWSAEEPDRLQSMGYLSLSLSHTHSVRYDLKTKQQQWG